MMKNSYLIILIVIGSVATGFAQQFSEQSQAIGFDHFFRARGLMGGGAAFFDYDNDGDEDFYITSGYNADNIYRNNGDGTFSKVVEEIGLGVTYNFNTMGVTTGDIDNDGDRDIFVTTWEQFLGSEQPDARSLLFLNNGDGTFAEIGESAGITHQAFGMGAAFVDYNKDGYLDVYVMNHIKVPQFTYDEDGAIVGFAHECYPNFLYLNNGDLTFTEVSSEMNVANEGCTIATVASDYDMDGDLDLYLANDFGYFLTPNTLYQNNYPDNSFTDVSGSTNANVQAFGMGIAAGDYDHDLDFDYYTTNIGRNILCENLGGTFVDVTTEAGVENISVPEEDNLNTTSWGTAFFDVDNDTWEDLFVANGRIPTLTQFATATNDPNKLFLNNGDKTFTDVSDLAGVSDVRYTHGMAYSDYDEDGDLDIVTVVLDELDGRSKFYINETENDNNYIQFKLIGVESNRDAFGSRAWIYANDLTLVKEIYGGGASHASQHTSVLHFGLGTHEEVDSVKIEWTNGHVDMVYNPAINMRHTVVEGVETAVHDPQLQQLDIAVAPNPFTNEVSLYTDKTFGQEPLQVRLSAMDGTIILNTRIDFNRQAQLKFDEELAPGMYILELRNSQGRTIRKLIKE